MINKKVAILHCMCSVLSRRTYVLWQMWTVCRLVVMAIPHLVFANWCVLFYWWFSLGRSISQEPKSPRHAGAPRMSMNSFLSPCRLDTPAPPQDLWRWPVPQRCGDGAPHCTTWIRRTSDRFPRGLCSKGSPRSLDENWQKEPWSKGRMRESQCVYPHAKGKKESARPGLVVSGVGSLNPT